VPEVGIVSDPLKPQRLVDLEDNDPDLGTRLTAQLEFLRGRLLAGKQEVIELQGATTATEAAGGDTAGKTPCRYEPKAIALKATGAAKPTTIVISLDTISTGI
jgi:hypothetical protein